MPPIAVEMGFYVSHGFSESVNQTLEEIFLGRVSLSVAVWPSDGEAHFW